MTYTVIVAGNDNAPAYAVMKLNVKGIKMKVLVACELSGVVRNAFARRGHDVISCDLLPNEDDVRGTSKWGTRHHICGDVLDLLNKDFDLMIAHPPCTYLAVIGAKRWETKQVEQRKAIFFFMSLAEADIPKICVENPVGIMSTIWHKPDQYIQPWQFGHGETKKTGLWLKNLPLLKPTNIVAGRETRIHKMPPSKDRSKLRSITYQGIADAMAEQWSP